MRAALFIAALTMSTPQCAPSAPADRIATLNLENYPKHGDQGSNALEMIRGLKVSAVALQEITRPEAFAAQAREELGPSWRFVWARPGGFQRVGLLYDSRQWDLIDTIAHEETLLHRQAKPAFEVVARPRVGGWLAGRAEPVHFFIVHLKATNKSEAIRARQLAALAPILAERRAAGKQVVFLGDFNSTNPTDRTRLDGLADTVSLSWASEDLDCTHYWARKEACTGHALDHVMTWAVPDAITVGGACVTDGCDPGDTCPVYRSRISDHCPVVVDLAPFE